MNARNSAAFWNGRHCVLTPASDIVRKSDRRDATKHANHGPGACLQIALV